MKSHSIKNKKGTKMENNVVGALLCEETNANVEFKVKDVTKSGFVIAEGILQEGNSVNRNKHFFEVALVL